MSARIEFYWPEYRLFPYERRLAKREIRELLGKKPLPASCGFRVATQRVPNGTLERFTYFGRVLVTGRTLAPLQARLEATAVANGNGSKARPTGGTPRSKRQSTRYSAHGIHEYRGKFNPQIVRAIGNILPLPRKAWVLDPFCGSGTTLLECAHIGWNAIGLDMNPLAVFIARTKVEALKLDSIVLQQEAAGLCRRLRVLSEGLDFGSAFERRHRLRLETGCELPNRPYLERWFAPSVLVQLERLELEARRLTHATVADLARLVLSDLLRSVSLQDPGDLRIRRRKDAKPNYSVIPMFVGTFERRVRAIVSARAVLGEVRGFQVAAHADARLPLREQLHDAATPRAFDGVITSPPYATALPYIDTQRLSLAFLGLATEAELGGLERALVGSREIGKRERGEDEAQIQAGSDALPTSVVQFCRTALSLVRKGRDGFRRQNMPALLFRYFHDMAQVFANVRHLMRPGAGFALVVGPNRTTLGGRCLTINTPRLLQAVAEHGGWQCVDLVALDAYPRYDVHQRNSIRTETLVILRRPPGW